MSQNTNPKVHQFIQELRSNLSSQAGYASYREIQNIPLLASNLNLDPENCSLSPSPGMVAQVLVDVEDNSCWIILNENSDLIDTPIKAHNKITAPFIIPIRKILKKLLTHIFEKQSIYNSANIRFLKRLNYRVNQIQAIQASQMQEVAGESCIVDLKNEISQLKEKNQLQEKLLSQLMARIELLEKQVP